MAKFVKIGGTQFNTSAMAGMDFDSFSKQYKGKLTVPLSDAWQVLKKDVPKKPVKKAPKKKGKK
tara:strand:- start:178 stop:369 length:192 start_codon:yes stop_codon:yes gene_type:complete